MIKSAEIPLVDIVTGSVDTPMLDELLQAVELFLQDYATVRRAYNPETGYVVMAIEDKTITPGTMDVLVAIVEERGYFCHWDQPFRAPPMDNFGDFEWPKNPPRYLYFAIPS